MIGVVVCVDGRDYLCCCCRGRLWIPMWWCDIRWQWVVSVETPAIVISHQHFFIAVVSRGGLISFCQETVVQAIFGGRESSRHILSTSYRHLIDMNIAGPFS